MKSNLESLKFVRNENSIELQIGLTGVDKKIYFYLLNAEIQPVLDCLSGKSAYYPMFNDIGQYMQFTPGGMHYVRLSPYCQKGSAVKESGVYYEHWIYLSGEWLSAILGHFTAKESYQAISKMPEYTLSNKAIEHMKYNNRSVSKFYYYDTVQVGKYEREFNNTELVKSVIWNVEHMPSFYDCMKALKRIANNSSNGQMIIIQVSFDCSDKLIDHPDFYFAIMDGNNRVMNGGIIYHESTNQYQMHT